MQHPVLVSEYTANYLVVRAVDLQVEEKHDEMKRVARQAVLMQVSHNMKFTSFGPNGKFFEPS
jgi:hypothetical protein